MAVVQSYQVITFIICLAAFFSYCNHRFIKWTPTIGIMVLSLVFSLLLVAATHLFPGKFVDMVVGSITALDFHDLLMNGMLSFLLFAGSIQIDAQRLRKEMLPVIMLATVGILISTVLVGYGLYWIFMLFGLKVNLVYCLLFAALISPTDPVAVLAILKRAGLSASLELKIAGESLFNDGVAVVVFLTILGVAMADMDNLSVMDISMLFARQAIGGLVFGYAVGMLSFYALKSVDKYEVEVMITIATVMGGYMLANMLTLSGPLAMVVAGIIIGNKGRAGVSPKSRDYLDKFWELVDEILNAILFLLIGFEMLVVKMDFTLFVISIITIVIVLLSRWVSVALPVMLMKYRLKFERHAIAILTWGGIRGGLSVALALSLPSGNYRDEFVSITYIVVVFSIIVQGLTIGKVYRKLSA